MQVCCLVVYSGPSVCKCLLQAVCKTGSCCSVQLQCWPPCCAVGWGSCIAWGGVHPARCALLPAADKTWKVLEDAIREIHNQNASGLSFEALYRLVQGF